jgi:uncharacterized protein YecA (UPF0149 family)
MNRRYHRISAGRKCRCGSGKKYKNCHGPINQSHEEMLDAAVSTARKQTEIARSQVEVR